MKIAVLGLVLLGTAVAVHLYAPELRQSKDR
jgi:hypothetical protein